MFENLKLAVATTAKPNLDVLYQEATRQWAAGHLTDEECQEVYDRISKRRQSIFPERSRRDRKKRPAEEIAARNRLAYSGGMPCTMAAAFTPCELAVLTVIAIVVKERGFCDLSIYEIRKRALVGHSTVQKAIRLAERLGLIAVEERQVAGRKNLPNVIRIVSPEWRTWLERGGSKKLKPLDTRFILSCNSSTSHPHIQAWKRLISRTSPGRFAIQSPQRR